MRGTTLYRRQLLVRPDLGPLPDANGYLVPQPNLSNSPPNYFSGAAWQGYNTNFYAVCDLSARATGKVPSTGASFDLSPAPPNFSVVSNSLEDLTSPKIALPTIRSSRRRLPTAGRTMCAGGILYSDTPFGNIAIGKSASANQQVPTTGRLGLPTLRGSSLARFSASRGLRTVKFEPGLSWQWKYCGHGRGIDSSRAFRRLDECQSGLGDTVRWHEPIGHGRSTNRRAELAERVPR